MDDYVPPERIIIPASNLIDNGIDLQNEFDLALNELVVTFPTGKYAFQGQTLYQYASRNANRMPDNHRLDISVTYDKKRKKKIQESWNFSLYNVYGRENAYRITFQDDPNNLSRTQIIQTSLFRWVPSITYQFKF